MDIKTRVLRNKTLELLTLDFKVDWALLKRVYPEVDPNSVS